MLLYQLNQLNEVVFQQVCDDATSETLTLEFKRELPGKEKDHKVEFLKDVAALANAAGGDLVYGIEESGGVAVRIHPIDSSIDAEKRRLGQTLDGGLEPRITGVRFQEVPVVGGYVLVLRIPQSYDGPHRISQSAHPKDGKFYLRSGTHISDMSYDQLKSAFDRTATLAERTKAFRRERLDAIQLGQTPKPVMPGPVCISHIIPLASLTGRHTLDVVELSRNPLDIMFYESQHNTWTLNLDGIVAYSAINNAHPNIYGYNQIYRTGCVESVFFGGGFLNDNIIPSTVITQRLRMAVENNVKLLKQSGLSGPAIVGLAMLNVKDYELGVRNNHGLFPEAVSDRNSLVIPEVWVESLDALTDIDEIVKPMMDILWQAFGEEKCLEYDNDRKWKPRS